MNIQKIAAWGVHTFTACGILTGFLALIAIGEKEWQMAFFWLFISLIIDGVDGTFARLFKVKENLPEVDGKNIDFVIDFANYIIFPVYFFYMAEMAPAAWMLPCVAVMLLSSALYYGKEGMVADDQYFVGFPALWNVVVFIAFFILHNLVWVNVVAVFILAIMHFVPLKYAYPSRSQRFFWAHLTMSVVGLGAAAVALWMYPAQSLVLEGLVMFAAVYFCVLAVVETVKKSG